MTLFDLIFGETKQPKLQYPEGEFRIISITDGNSSYYKVQIFTPAGGPFRKEGSWSDLIFAPPYDTLEAAEKMFESLINPPKSKTVIEVIKRWP